MFQALQSSAGAGKTHTLVKHYLRLALSEQGDDGYRRILALTFTNKAAAEMRERALAYLAGLGGPDDGDERLADVRNTILEATGGTAGALREQAAAMRTHMLHHWSQLAITTIDAFTRRVVVPFARDLQLDAELRMTTEEDHYRRLAVEELLSEAGQDADVTPLLEAICDDLLDQERAWCPDRPLAALAVQLSKESAMLPLERLRSIAPATYLAERARLRAEVRMQRTHLQQLGQRALEAVHAGGLMPEHLAGGANGVHGLLRKLARGEVMPSLNTHAARALERDAWASGKGAPHAAAIARVAPVLREVVGIVGAEIKDGTMRRHALRSAMLRELLTSAALHLLDERLEQVKRREGVTFFSDLTRKVAGVVERERAPFLFERIGERYTHFLIDEFQDTSMLQWRTLLPLITNALGSGGSALLVGDAKQAIYRWRNGEVRQFVHLPALFGKEHMAFGEETERALVRAHGPTAPLDRNFRSARVIVELNNALFAALGEGASPAQQLAYATLSQAPVRDHGGLVHLHAYAPDDSDEEEPVSQAVAFAGARVREALDDGASPDDIAVLVRTRDQGRQVAAHLLERNIDVISPDGLSLEGDPATATVMALLRLVHRPSPANTQLAGQLLVSLHPPPIAGVPPGDPGIAATLWLEHHAGVRQQTTLLNRLHRIMHALGLDPAQDAFLLTLMDHARAHVQERGEDEDGFLEAWARTIRRKSVAGSTGGAVRIMTVHASKGLQFPVVVLPWADMRTKGRRDPLWVDTSEISSELPTALVRPGKDLEQLDLPELQEERALGELDQINLVYVAFTRAETRLYAGLPGTGKDNLATRLRRHLSLEPGDTKVLGVRARLEAGDRKTRVPGEELRPTGSDGTWTLAVRSRVAEDGDPPGGDVQRAYGQAVHAVLALVRTANDLREAITRAAPAQGLGPAEQRELFEQLAPLLSSHAFRPFFGEGLIVHRETTLTDASGNALRPDRVVQDAGGTRVLDLKTGIPDEQHLEQVRAYAGLLRQLVDGPVSAHLFYLKQEIIIDA